MKDTIKVTVGQVVVVDINDLHEFQGELKELTHENYERMKASIIKHGISFLKHAWEGPGSRGLMIMDGHQTKRTPLKMREEGYTIPKIPVALVEAGSIKEAKEKLLAAASQYGEVTSEGLYQFMHEAGIDYKTVEVTYAFPEIDMQKFNESYFVDPPEMSEQAPTPPPRGDQADGIEGFLNNDIRYIQLVFPIAEYDRVVARMDALCEEHDTSDYSALISKLIGVDFEKIAPDEETGQPGSDWEDPPKRTVRRRPR